MNKSIIIAIAVTVLAVGGGAAYYFTATPATSEVSSSPGAPFDLYAAEAFPEAVSLDEAKSSTKAGEAVVFEALVGGRKDPFVDGKSVMQVADLSLDHCGYDHCPTPWDACCVEKQHLAAHSATVMVVGEDGNARPFSLRASDTLEPDSIVQIKGTTRLVNEKAFIVEAEKIHVKELRRSKRGS